jgi:flagellar biosynthesis anti-sigma factor FlgM
MRIDLSQATESLLTSDPNPNQVSKQNSATTELTGGEDRTTLASAQQSIGTLVGTAMSSPDVRQNLVDSLKQSSNSGQYELNPGKIASSMIDEHA